ncbi:MAG: phage tail protein [Cyanobacteria bacterium P01_A01_bin.37]
MLFFRPPTYRRPSSYRPPPPQRSQGLRRRVSANVRHESRSPNHAINYVLENRFYVEIENQITASFASCQGLSAKITTTASREGGVNDQQRIFLGPTSFTEVTLTRGMTDSLLFWNWIKATFTGGCGLRRNINILTFNQAGETMMSWTLIGAIPVSWKAPGLKADGSNIAVEEISIAFEGLKVIPRGGGGGADESVERDRLGYFGS